MNGSIMYDMARQRIADQHRQAERRRSARQAVRARKQAEAAARGRNAGAAQVPVIPDYAHEMFSAARDAVPPQRLAAEPGRPTRADR